jgi:predicted  nucleic acid-binding Zn-ribbon protein
MNTKQRVFELADELLVGGNRPTLANIREMIEGQPSNTTLSDALQAYWIDLGARIQTLQSRPDIPQPLFEAIKGIWTAALDQAEAEYRLKRRELAQKEHDANARVEKAILDRDAALERQEALHHDIEAGKKQAHYLEGLLQSERERRADAEQQRKRLEEKLQQRENEFEHLQAVMEEKMATAEAQMAQERSRSEQAENRLLQEIDRLRQTIKEHQQSHAREQAMAQEKQQSLETALLQSRDMVTSLENKRSALEGQVQVLEERIERLDNQRQAVELRVENLQLKVEVENREKVAAQHALALAESREAELHERIRQMEKRYAIEEKKLVEREEALQAKVRELERSLQTRKHRVDKISN